MNLNSVFTLAKKEMACAEVEVRKGWLRHEVVNLLEGNDNIGIELGVAKWVYAQKMMDSNKFARLYGVDLYGDVHDTNEYCHALRHIGFQDPRYFLLWMDFESLL